MAYVLLFFMTLVISKILDRSVGLRVSEEDKVKRLGATEANETAYTLIDMNDHSWQDIRHRRLICYHTVEETNEEN